MRRPPRPFGWLARDAEECAAGRTVEAWPGTPLTGKREQIRERSLAVLVDGMPCPICSSPMFRHHMLDLHHTDAAGR